MQQMKSTFSTILVLAAVLCLGSREGSGASNQDMSEPAGQTRGEDLFVAGLLADLAGVEEKTVALAEAFTDAQYAWRPAEGVRSGAEVFMHVVTINYAFPIFVGHEAPGSTGLTMENLRTVAPAYETSRSSKDEIRPDLSASFDHLRTAIEASAASGLDRQVTVFGDTATLRVFWMRHLGHLHEHLGQLIAYGRMNGVVPPWSE